MLQSLRRAFRGVSIMTYTVVFITLSYLFTLSVVFVLLFQSFGNTGRAELSKTGASYAGIVERKFDAANNALNVAKSLIEPHIGEENADRERLQEDLGAFIGSCGLKMDVAVLIAPDLYDHMDKAYIDSPYGMAGTGRLAYRYTYSGADGETLTFQCTAEGGIEGYYQRAVEQNTYFRTDVFFRDYEGTAVPKIVVGCPLRDRAGQVVGVVAAELWLDDLFEQLAAETAFYSLYVFISDENDRLFYHPKTEYIGQKREDIGSRFAVSSTMVQRFRKNEGSDYNRASSYVAATIVGIPQTDSRLFVCAVVPAIEVYTEWIRLTVVFGVISILILCLILHYISRSVITPIKEITGMASLIANGDPEGRDAFDRVSLADIQENTRNEVHLLYIATSKMLEQLRQIEMMKLEALRLKHEKERAEESTRTKSDFLARTSHEIRTPMNAIIGMSELILRQPVSDEVKELSVGIKQAGASLLSIIDDILDLTKIESGKMEINAEPYRPESLLDDIISIVRMRILDKPVLFVTDTDAAIPAELIGDELRIRQILLNLLSNAAKFTEKGHIRLSMGGIRDGDSFRMTIEVEDTGIGIREEDLEKIFAAFVQVAEAQNRSIRGTGLGLAISRRFCLAMGGDITVHSTFGKGSVFTVTLPQGIADSAAFARVQNAASLHTLLYETRDIYAGSLSRTMDNLGVSCTVADTRARFYEEMKSGRYDFIFMSSFLYESVKSMMENGNSAGDRQNRAVLIAKYGELPPGERGNILEMPAHSRSAARILNNEMPGRDKRPEEDGPRFVAPDARVLLVDDIATNLCVAEGLLSPYRMQIDTCPSGADAIALVMEKRYDLVFMDHMMPDMDGVEATQIIRAIESEDGYHRNLPIVALTANAVAGVREMFLEKGMSDFLSKPIDLKKLDAILEKWIPAEKQLSSSEAAKTLPQDKMELSVKGLDVALGMKMSGGRKELYLKALATFYQDGRQKITEIENALQTNDIPLYTTLVHAVKSAGAAIGAKQLSGLAKLLEEAGRNSDILFLVNFTEDLIRKLKELTEAIGAVLPSKPIAAPEESRGIFHRELARLKEALQTLNAVETDKALNLLQSHGWGEEGDALVRQLGRDVLLYNYEEAVALIDRALHDGGT